MPDIYVQITNEPVHRTSCHSDNTVNVDLDGNGVPVGVEVLNAIGLEVDGQPVHLPEAIGEADTEKLAAHLYATDCRDHGTDEGLSDAELWKSSSYTTGERDGHYRVMARAALDFLGGAE